MNIDTLSEHFVTGLVGFTALLALLTLVGLFPLEPVAQAATVNGEVITLQELQETYNQLPEQFQEQYSQAQVLDQLIDKELILQEAELQGITVSQEEVDAFISEQVASLGISERELKSTLKAGGISYEEYEEAVYEELVLRTFVEQEIVANIDANSTQEQQVLGAQAFQQRINALREEANIQVFIE